ncbi:MAG: radical SAM protein [bacterium]
MYYLKNKEVQELSEIVHFETEYDQTLPYFADLNSTLQANSLLELVSGLQIIPGSADSSLFWHPDTAMWCYVDSNEMHVCQELEQTIRFSTLQQRFPQYRREDVTKLLTHLYRRGLLKIDDQPGLDPGFCENAPLFKKAYLVELYMTEKCNLGCKYCFAEAAPDNSTMPVEIGYLAIDKAFALPATRFIIEFAGGETFVEFGTFQRLVEYIAVKKKQTGKDPQIVVQSNGTLYHKSHIRKFILRHNIITGVSIDGPPEVQNAVRPTAGGKESSDAVLRGIKALQKTGFEVATITTVNRANVDRPEEIVDYFVSRNIHYGLFKEMLGLGRAEASWHELAVGPEEFFEFIKRVLEYTTENNIFFRDLTTKRLIRNLLVRTRSFRCMRSPCNAGVDYFVIRPNGDIYPCADHVRPELKMGNIKDPEPLHVCFEKQPTVVEMKCHRSVKNIPGCRSCDWRHLCEAECGLAALKSYGTLYHASPKCQFYKMVYPYLLGFSQKHPEVICDYWENAEVVRFSLVNDKGSLEA